MTDQIEFTESLLDPKKPVPTGLVDPEGRPTERRFSVYRNNVVHSLISALGDAYPAVKKNVGDAFFEAMAGLFVRQYPPSSPMMMSYGEEFPSFLQGFKPANERPFLPDLAELERLMRESYHSSDDTVFDPSELASLDENALMALRFKPRASAKLMKSDTPALSYWMHLVQNSAPPSQNMAEYILITRPELDIAATSLTSAQFEFFGKIGDGEALETAFDAAAAIDAEFDFGTVLGILFQSSFLSSTQ